MAKKKLIEPLNLETVQRNIAVPKIRFSASKLKTIKDCYGKYFYRNIAEYVVPEKTWPATIFGLVCHSILEKSLLERMAGESEANVFKKYTQDNVFSDMFKELITAEKERGRAFNRTRYYKEDEFIADGEKNIRVLLRFVLGYFKEFHKLLPEEKFTEDWQWDDEITVNGIADLPVFLDDQTYRIIDFKTTQYSENFYFVNWTQDIQSLMYLYMSYKKFGTFAQGFDYLVFNWKEHNIFLNSITHVTPPQNDEELKKFFDAFQGLHSLLTSAKIMHRKPKKSYYFPEPEKCKWCEFNKICDQAINE